MLVVQNSDGKGKVSCAHHIAYIFILDAVQNKVRVVFFPISTLTRSADIFFAFD